MSLRGAFNIKTQLSIFFAGTKSYGFSYSENYKPDNNRPNGLSVRGVVRITFGHTSEDAIVCYESWHFHEAVIKNVLIYIVVNDQSICKLL